METLTPSEISYTFSYNHIYPMTSLTINQVATGNKHKEAQWYFFQRHHLIYDSFTLLIHVWNEDFQLFSLNYVDLLIFRISFQLEYLNFHFQDMLCIHKTGCIKWRENYSFEFQILKYNMWKKRTETSLTYVSTFILYNPNMWIFESTYKNLCTNRRNCSIESKDGWY